MTANSDTDYIEKRIGHSFINWKIENYCLATCRENWKIKSPEFYVRGYPTTKWMMILNPKSKVKDTFCITLYLQRLESDPEPDIVWVNWRLTLLDKQEKEYCSTECEYYFEKKSNYGVDLLKMTDILEKLRPFDQDTLHIRCQLIVTHEDAPRKFKKPVDIGLLSLSQDLRVLYKRSKYHDIFIKTDNKVIRAHKTVLYSRNRVFADLIDQAKGKNTITLGLDNDALEKVIGYLYSGNLEFVLSKPSISLHTCVMHFQIGEVMYHYVPDELTLHTAIDVQEFAFLWLITDFINRNGDCIRSPILNKGLFETCWRLSLYPKGVADDDKHLAIYAEMVEGMKPMDVCIEFAIMNDNEEFLWSRRLSISTEENEIFGCNDFIPNELLVNSSLLEDNTLLVAFKLRISKGEKVSSVGNLLMPFVSKKEYHYQSLAMDMEGMYEFGQFRDITLFIQEKPFLVHKCILAARSPVFAAKFENMMEDKMYLDGTNIKPNILQIVLNYIYCGVLKDFKVRDLLHVYDAADIFAVSSLRDVCSRILQSNIALGNVCNILIFADTKKDNDLKLSALKFVCHNGPEVFKHQSWVEFTNEKPFYSADVLNYVKYNHERLKPSTETQGTSQGIS